MDTIDNIIAKTNEELVSQLMKDNSKLKEDNTRLLQESKNDPLTEIYNRRALDDFVEKYESFSPKRSSDIKTVVLLDIDDFKIYNDTHGHITGDSALKYFSSILKTNSRSTDFVGRYGGEEFILILDGGYISAIETISRIRESLDKSFESEGIPKFGFSGGAKKMGDLFYDDLAKADSYLYIAKEKGKGNVVYGGLRRAA